jgi:uncharacterized protein (UPF0216 family)
MPHSDFPKGLEEMWDITAKAMLLRAGGAVYIERTELENAAKTPCEMEMLENGILFRMEGKVEN